MSNFHMLEVVSRGSETPTSSGWKFKLTLSAQGSSLESDV